MIDVENRHLGGTTGDTAGFNRAGSLIADFKKAHNAGGRTATGEAFLLCWEKLEPRRCRILNRRARAATNPYNATLAHQIIRNR